MRAIVVCGSANLVVVREVTGCGERGHVPRDAWLEHGIVPEALATQARLLCLFAFQAARLRARECRVDSRVALCTTAVLAQLAQLAQLDKLRQLRQYGGTS